MASGILKHGIVELTIADNSNETNHPMLNPHREKDINMLLRTVFRALICI